MSWPGSRRGCGRPTTDASRRVSSARSSRRSRAGRVSWPRALAASLLLTRAAAGFARSTGDYERFAPDIGRAYRLLGLPEEVDVEEVARRELRWWTIRREMGLAAGEAAGDVITDLYAGHLPGPARAGRRGRSTAGDGGRSERPWRSRRHRGLDRCRSGVLAAGREAAARFVSEPSPRPRYRHDGVRVGRGGARHREAPCCSTGNGLPTNAS